jgi:endogenous inhibitor of DNA gyrase (YacG/DUF329 family)
MTDRYAMKALDDADFTRKLAMGKKEPMVTCPNCGGDGYTGIEEDSGRPYTCYRCCETGMVTKASADAEAYAEAVYRAEAEAAAIAKRKRLGIPDGYGYRIDEVDGEVILIPPRVPYKAAPVDYSEDLPF